MGDMTRVQVMGLWKGQGQAGPYLRGKLGDMMVWVFPNDRKKSAREPDYRVFVSEDRGRPEAAPHVPVIQWGGDGPAEPMRRDPDEPFPLEPGSDDGIQF